MIYLTITAEITVSKKKSFIYLVRRPVNKACYLGSFIPMGSTNVFLFFYFIPNSQFLFLSSMCGQKRWLLTFSLHCLCSSTSRPLIRSLASRLHLVYWTTLKIANDLPIFACYYALLCIYYCFSQLIDLFSVT